MRKRLATFLLVVLPFILGGCGAGREKTVQAEYIFRYAENQPEDYPTTQAAFRFAEMVEEETDGRIRIEVYCEGALGDERSVIEQMRFGGVDFTRVSLSSLAEFSNSLNVLQLPYLYRSDEHMWNVLDGEIGDAFLNRVTDAGVTGLSWFDSGARNFYNSVREIHSIEDVAGLRIRVQESKMMADMVRVLGAQPIPLAYSEVYAGLQTGLIDGAENNWPSFESTGHYEVARYYVLDEHTRVPEMQLISTRTLEKLSESDREILYRCAKESALIERRLWAEREQHSKEQVRLGGAVITTLSAEEKLRFEQAMKPLYEKYAGDEMDIVEAIREVES